MQSRIDLFKGDWQVHQAFATASWTIEVFTHETIPHALLVFSGALKKHGTRRYDTLATACEIADNMAAQNVRA